MNIKIVEPYHRVRVVEIELTAIGMSSNLAMILVLGGTSTSL